MDSTSYVYKIDQLYKYISEGWSVPVSESKANLKPGNTNFRIYKSSEHFQRVRNIVKGRKNVI